MRRGWGRSEHSIKLISQRLTCKASYCNHICPIIVVITIHLAASGLHLIPSSPIKYPMTKDTQFIVNCMSGK